jgi:hypothetical protein
MWHPDESEWKQGTEFPILRSLWPTKPVVTPASATVQTIRRQIESSIPEGWRKPALIVVVLAAIFLYWNNGKHGAGGAPGAPYFGLESQIKADRLRIMHEITAKFNVSDIDAAPEVAQVEAKLKLEDAALRHIASRGIPFIRIAKDSADKLMRASIEPPKISSPSFWSLDFPVTFTSSVRLERYGNNSPKLRFRAVDRAGAQLDVGKVDLNADISAGQSAVGSLDVSSDSWDRLAGFELYIEAE